MPHGTRTLGAVAVLMGCTFGAVRIGGAEPGAPGDARAERYETWAVRDGAWGDATTWRDGRLPKRGDRVLIAPGRSVVVTAKHTPVIKLIHVAGTLRFATDADTELNVCVIKVQPIAAVATANAGAVGVDDVHEGDDHDRHHGHRSRPIEAALEIGRPGAPIASDRTAVVRLHLLDGMDPTEAPAIIARPGGRIDLCGAPLSRTWVELGATVETGDTTVRLAEPVMGWRIGDEILVTGSEHDGEIGCETRRVVAIDGASISVDKPFAAEHVGDGRMTSEVANLSRNVVIVSAEPDRPGARGHTMYHRFAAGSIRYARFVSLGKKGVLGRYPIHFHLVRDTMRGSSVVGAAIVDSDNRWVTVHGTQYMVVRDCVGYGSIGHGYFLEDGTEVYNVIDRNLGVGARDGPRMKGQALPFDPNDGAAFWWANGRNTFVRNVAAENGTYGFRYDSQKRSNFDSTLPVRQPDGSTAPVDIRTLANWRFADNESHTEGLYSFAFAGTDGAGPDAQHPHRLVGLDAWQTHYAFRLQLPTMLVVDCEAEGAAYGIYRPWFDHHVYRNLRLANVAAEPFNRGLDDRSEQHGVITIDGLTFEGRRYGGMPFVQISDNNLSGKAASHFRNVVVPDAGDRPYRPSTKPVFDRGGGAVVDPRTETGVPIFVHDHFAPGRHAKIVSTKARDFRADGLNYKADFPLTGKHAAVAEVRDLRWPKLLDPVDDHAPTTVVTWPRPHDTVRRNPDGSLTLEGTTTDNTATARVVVNGQPAEDLDYNYHRWRITLRDVPQGPLKIRAAATDTAGNTEITPHEFIVRVE